jgi:hypothetical protein
MLNSVRFARSTAVAIGALASMGLWACKSDDVAEPGGDEGSAPSAQAGADDTAYTVEGSIGDRYSGEEVPLWLFGGSGLDPVGTGRLNPDGGFSMTLNSSAEFGEERLSPVVDSGSGFRMFPCVGADDVDQDVSFVAAIGFSWNDPETNDPHYITLSDQTEGRVDINTGMFSNEKQERRVIWVYASDDVEVSGACSSGRTIDLQLNRGWNEVYYGQDDEGHWTMMNDGDRSELSWYTAS